jgi:hypothetical protein
MDQLKQVLKYQFWILLGVALILPLVGWAMTSSGMQAEATARADVLKKLNDSLTAGPTDPNNEWTDGLTVINTEQEKQKDLAWRALHELQAPFHVWPANMPDDPAKIDTMHQDIYKRTGYISEIERIRKIVKPVDEDWQGGLLRFPDELLPPLEEGWKFSLPSRAEIESAQEDIWLYTALLSAIARVNGEAVSVYDAPIREIVELMLRGGSPRGSASAGAGAGGGAKSSTASTGPLMGSAGMESAMKSRPPMGGMAGMGGMGGMGGVGGAAGEAVQDVKISLDEDLGAQRPAATANTSGKTASDGASAGTAGGNSAPPGGGVGAAAAPPPTTTLTSMGSGLGGTGLGTGRGSDANMNRYCDDKRKEWKTRGFYMELVMDHQLVPYLLVELSNCPGWPVNVLRVHVADLQDEDLQREDGGMGTGMGGVRSAGGGFGGGLGSSRGAEMRMMAPKGQFPLRGDGEGLGASPGGAPRARQPAARNGGDESGDAPAVLKRLPLDDPNLARVAVVGVIYIFSEPKPIATAAPGAPSSPAPAAAPVAQAPAEEEKAATAGDAAADADEKAEMKPEEGESPDDPAGKPSTAPGENDDSESKPAPDGKSPAGESKETS